MVVVINWSFGCLLSVMIYKMYMYVLKFESSVYLYIYISYTMNKTMGL